jgi:7-carboxy-7-deazaguanine synthase
MSSLKAEKHPRPAPAGHLRVTESYLCLEGEGSTLGATTYLIRLSGCNLRCWWCDSKFSSFREDEARPVAWKDLLSLALASGAAWVSFTGGEPTWRGREELKAMAGLCAALRKAGRKIKVETNGLLLPGLLARPVDLWSVAPKWDGVRNGLTPAMRHDPRVLSSFVRKCRGRLQLKFVITAQKDGRPRESDLERVREVLKDLPGRDFPVFLIPEGQTSSQAYLQRNRLLAQKIQDTAADWKGWDLKVQPQWHRVLHGDQRKK